MPVVSDRSFILRPSTIKGAGVGIFALHDIPAGTPLPLFSPDFKEELVDIDSVPEPLRVYCLDQPDGKMLCPTPFNRLDIGHYINHSRDPNVSWSEQGGHIARRDIKKDEELFADYRELDEPKELWEAYY